VAIYKVDDNKSQAVERTTFDEQKIFERQHLQAMLRDQIDIISPDTMVVAEEFGEWDGKKHRIDLLGLKSDGCLVVIELKRTEDGGYMELQSLRYASMISTLTFSRLVSIYKKYLENQKSDTDAESNLLDFLGWEAPDDELFAQEVKIVLASAEFSKELTTSVIWLNDFGIDIRCVRMHPYINDGQLLVDIQTVIPIPETADYQVKIREKKQQERASRSQSRDFTKFNLIVGGVNYPSLNKRKLIHHVVSSIIKSQHTPNEVQAIVDSVPERKARLFEVFDGELGEDDLQALIMADDPGGRHPRTARFFCKQGEYYFSDGKSYVLTNQWGHGTLETVEALSDAFPVLGISFSASE
jgi:hypothetical protein